MAKVDLQWSERRYKLRALLERHLPVIVRTVNSYNGLNVIDQLATGQVCRQIHCKMNSSLRLRPYAALEPCLCVTVTGQQLWPGRVTGQCVRPVVCLVFRSHRSTTYVDAAYVTDRVARSVGRSVCRSVCLSRSRALQKPLNRSRWRLGCGLAGGYKEALLGGGAHWRNLANTTESSMCGGDAAFLSNYFDHLSSFNTRIHRNSVGSE